MAHRALATDPPHLKRAFADLGLSEIRGKKHEPRVLELFALAGHPGIKDDETAWCAGAMGGWLAEAGEPNSGSLMARSYSKYGKGCDLSKPLPRGAICVWPRDGFPGSGHVNLAIEDDGTYVTCIGANQENGRGGGVTITRYRKSKLVAARIPFSMVKKKPVPKPVPAPKPAPVEPGPELEPAPVDQEPTPTQEPQGSWLKRKWRSVTGWFGVGGAGGILGFLTDPWVVVAIGVVLLIAVCLFIYFMGPERVREWIRKQVS
jgi:uncharacterized protein (TIGR02594 family)